MERLFHLVDYYTPMTQNCPDVINLNEVFTMSSNIGSSHHLQKETFEQFFKTFDFNENNIHEPFIQKFEELNPIIKHDRFHYKIYPDIRFTIPNGFRLSINCLIPGLSIKHIKMRKKAGITYHWIHEIDLPDNTHTRLVGTKNKYQMIHIQEIEFEIRDTEFIVCTNTGIKILRDQFPDTDILNIEFICLNKVLPELYSDRPTPNPIYGCNDPEHYYLFHVIRNSTLYNYMYI